MPIVPFLYLFLYQAIRIGGVDAKCNRSYASDVAKKNNTQIILQQSQVLSLSLVLSVNKKEIRF